MECLNEIIGITQTDCPCVLTGLSTEDKALLKVSKSGLYLDDLEGGLNMRSITALDSCKNFAQMALSARASAIKKLYADILVALNSKYKSDKTAFVGNIGRPSYATTLIASQQYQYLKISPRNSTDAMFTLTGLRVIVDRAATINLTIYRSEVGGNQGAEVFTGSQVAAMNTYVAFPLPDGKLELPLYINSQPVEYHIIWDRVAAGAANPKDLKISCDCGFKTDAYNEYVKIESGEMTDVNMLTQKSPDNKFSRGILLDVDLRCSAGSLMCNEYDRDNAIAVTMAWATMYKSGELLIEQVLNSYEITRYTMMNREALYGKRAHFKKEYEARIMYLASVIDVSSSDCFICRDNQMYVGSIVS